MANSTRKKITNSKKPLTTEEKRKRLDKKHSEWENTYTCDYCFSAFIISRLEKDNTKATISFYKRFFIKYSNFLKDYLQTSPKEQTIEILVTEPFLEVFKTYIRESGGNTQTVNSYLRGLRTWGNWCEEQGYIEGFKCPIKEVEPPVKQVYSDRELEKLMAKPNITDFTDFRTYCIISLILNTGARSNTILNIRLCDLELEEGYINFNTTKAHKVVRLGLERKTKRDLEEWVNYWRYDKGAEPTDYLFCSVYGEQLSRSQLDKSVAAYNRERGVEKTSIHLLRHTFAKKWITSGGDIISLARVLTHSELEMVKRYSNLYGTDIKKEIEEHSAISQMKQKSGATLKNQKKRRLTDD